MSKTKVNDEGARFEALLDGAEEISKQADPDWELRTPQERKTALEWALRCLLEIRWRIRWKKFPYDSQKAMKQAMGGNDDDLCRLLVCNGVDLLGAPWVVERYRRAYAERDRVFMWKFWGAAHEHFSVSFLKTKSPEPRSRLLSWLIVNPELRERMTALELLDAFEKHKQKYNILEKGFKERHRVQNFRRWLTQHGIALGRKGKRRVRRSFGGKVTRVPGMSDKTWSRLLHDGKPQRKRKRRAVKKRAR